MAQSLPKRSALGLGFRPDGQARSRRQMDGHLAWKRLQPLPVGCSQADELVERPRATTVLLLVLLTVLRPSSWRGSNDGTKSRARRRSWADHGVKSLGGSDPHLDSLRPPRLSSHRPMRLGVAPAQTHSKSAV